MNTGQRTYYTTVDSPVGPLLLTADESGVLTSLSVPEQKGGRVPAADRRREPAAFREAERQLAAYFAGELKEFRLASRAEGTEFRQRVWAALDDVPYGATTTYGAIAARIGAPRAAGTGRRRRDRRQPSAHRPPLPPGDRRGRLPHRLRRRPRPQAPAARPGGRAPGRPGRVGPLPGTGEWERVRTGAPDGVRACARGGRAGKR